MNSKKFGEFVYNKRYEQGLTMANAAEKMHISTVQLRNIETGRNAPRPDTFFKIISVLGIDSKEAISILEDEQTDTVD